MPKVKKFDRELVINQATDVFHDKGYNATSMQDLVDATGLNRSSIYNSFESKQNLFLECLANYQNTYKNKMEKGLLKAENSLEAIDFIFDLYLQDILLDAKDKGCLMVNCKSEMANQDESILRFLDKNQNFMTSFLEDVIAKGQKEQLINLKRTASEYALYLYTAIQGFRMTGILTNNKNVGGSDLTIAAYLNLNSLAPPLPRITVGFFSTNS